MKNANGKLYLWLERKYKHEIKPAKTVFFFFAHILQRGKGQIGYQGIKIRGARTTVSQP